MHEEVQEAINVLWGESLRLNCSAAYEATHIVLRLLKEAEANLDEETQPK